MFKDFFNYDLDLQIGQSMLTHDNHNRIPYILKDHEGGYRVIWSLPIIGNQYQGFGDKLKWDIAAQVASYFFSYVFVSSKVELSVGLKNILV